MKIYSMTATFGKLEHETLTLQPGLNIIEAPNEWGKSTWCAFLTAMLYGIETRVHTTKTALADKERFAPWSGSPMAGRIDLHWNGRDITVERRSKGRSVFGVFRAYETDTGLDVPELTAANCGQVLLGVEKSVFLRAGFLRLGDLPVAQDEALRRRLNAIVTTGDESGTGDALAQTLKDLKNRCRLNRSNGLLPQAEAQKAALEDKLMELRQLRNQREKTRERLQQLEEHQKLLLNHRRALEYDASRGYLEKLAAAQTAEEAAKLRETQAQAACAGLPEADTVERTLLRLRQLRDSRDSLHLEAQMLPPPPQAPEVSPAFLGVTPETAVSQAKLASQVYAEDSKKRSFPWYAIVMGILGAGALFVPHWAGIAAGAALLLAAVILSCSFLADRRRRQRTVRDLLNQYRPIPPEHWVSAAQDHARRQADFAAATERHRTDRQLLETRLEALKQELDTVTGGRSLQEATQFYTDAQASYTALAEARRERRRATELVQALGASQPQASAPEFPDTMTYTPQETARLLSDCTFELRQLQQRLGHGEGRMEALGSEAALESQLEGISRRIAALEDTYAALELAQMTLARATAELQRRFAPQISKRAQEIFSALTGGRYTRLTLAEDLTIHAGTDTEDTLHSALWRSEGTVDQLYLSLRLAVAEALTPNAPLILDDALVRFDDTRLQRAIAVLREAADQKQVILFTCQSREKHLSEES